MKMKYTKAINALGYREKMRVVDKYINGHTSAAKNKVIGRLH
jgi:hypothetical protein